MKYDKEFDKIKKIERILIDGIGWIYSDNVTNTSNNETSKFQPIEKFIINGGEIWYRKGSDEFNGRYVISVVYYK